MRPYIRQLAKEYGTLIQRKGQLLPMMEVALGDWLAFEAEQRRLVREVLRVSA